jgi:hypothetical protein
MQSIDKRSALKGTSWFTAAYCLASWLDLLTTRLALRREGTVEGNIFATQGGHYDAWMAWATTVGVGVLLVALFAYGAVRLDTVPEHFLRAPVRSFLSWQSNLLFLNPWSRSAQGRIPLHAVSVALAFVCLRVVAAANNMSISMTGWGPLGHAVGLVSRWTSPLLGFTAVVGLAFATLTLWTAHVLAGRLLRARLR